MSSRPLRHGILAAAGVLSMVFVVPAFADAAQTSFCARLASQAEPACVPAERGPQAAWDEAAATWKPESGAAPMIALWAAPGVSIVELARNKNAKLDFLRQVGVAMAFAKTKDPASYAASLRQQLEEQEKLKARAEDLIKTH